MGSDTICAFGTTVHAQPDAPILFHVITTNRQEALRLAQHYLSTIGADPCDIRTKECAVFHRTHLGFFTEVQQDLFRRDGGFILPLSHHQC